MKTQALLAAAAFCAALPVHAALLPAPITSVLSQLIPGGPKKFLVHVEAEGARVGWTPDGAIVFHLNGGVYAGSPLDNAATVGAGHGPHLGAVSHWWLTLKVGSAGYTNLDTRIGCNPCRIALDDGGVLEALVDNRATPWPEIDIPLDARLLPELGPVSTDDALRPAHVRTAGCIGLREVAGRGALAHANGTLCLNGVVKLPAWPADNATLGAMSSMALESDSTLTQHRPLVDAITVK